MKTRNVVGVVTAAVCMVAGLAWAQTRGGSGDSEKNVERARQYMTWKLNDTLDEIDADPQQREVVNGLKDQLFDDGVKLRQTGHALREELLGQWKSPTPNEQVAHAAVDRALDEVRGFAHKLVGAGMTLHQTLRPEQREQVTQKLGERRRGCRW